MESGRKEIDAISSEPGPLGGDTEEEDYMGLEILPGERAC